jgi:hypothetical protein
LSVLATIIGSFSETNEKEMIMKTTYLSAVVIAAALSIPALASAQSNAPLTRAEVRAQLVALEQTGYSPASNNINYPQDVQAAQRAVNSQQADTSYGPSTAGSSAQGVHISAPADLYSHS